MAKKELNEDLLAGGSLSAEDKKASKAADKAAKKQAKAEKVKAKNDVKRAKIKAEMDDLKAKKAEETDEKKIEELNAAIKKLSDKYSAVGSTAGFGVSKNTAKVIKSVVCVVVVVALLATYVCTGAVRKGFISYTGLPAKAFTAVTVTNGKQKANIKVETYNFYFATTYNSISSQQSTYQQYGLDLAQVGLDVNLDEPLAKQDYTDKDTNKTITWAEHIHNMVIDSIENTYTFYLAAVEANDGKEPEITDEQKEELEELIKNYEEQANKYGYTLSGYLVAAMGKGVTEKVLTREVTRQYIAENYQKSLTSDVESKNYTDDDLKKYKDENLDSLKTVDIKLFECSSEDDAKAFKKALKADGSNFADLCVKYSSEDSAKVAYADDGYSTMLGINRTVLQSGGYAIGTADAHDHEDGEEEEHTYAGLDWLFDKSRKAGDSYQSSTTVVYVLAPASLTDRTTINVRHILIKPLPDSDDQSAATDKDWVAAFDSAKSILNEWKKGDKTEDSFAALAKEKTQDTGSADNGGLYENVVTGQMVNPFSTWCFDNSRKAGDTAIVRSQFGYHIMYFVKANDEKIWEYNAKQALSSSDGSSQIEKLEEDYTANVNWFGSRYFEKDTDISN